MKKLTLLILYVTIFAGFNCDTSDETISDQAPLPTENEFSTVTRITPGGINAGDNFGFSIAATQEFTVASAPNDNEKGQRTGALYIFRRNGLNFESRAEILYPESATVEDQFGWSIDMDGETLVVGAPKNDKMGEDAGAVYIYRHTGNNSWNLVKELTAPNPQENQQFGRCVVIDQGVVFVSSYFDNDNYFDDGPISNGAGIAQGSVFVYNEINNWDFSEKLVPDEGQGHRWDAFGSALAVDGNYLAIGAKGTDNTDYKDPGSVYIFHKEGANWSQIQKIEASDGQQDDFFGANIDIEGDDLAITSPGSFNSLLPDLSDVYGAAYVFSRSGSNFTEQIKLLAQNALPEDDFGAGGISLHKDYVIVGAPLTEVATRFNGAAYFSQEDRVGLNHIKLRHQTP